ncbi:PAS domain S-box protein [Rhizobium sp. BK251]|uniref:PAS domain S-box protein n=1 Tax=Rhizobium sp. BK251 TaxID=2512125 RepID=UPI001FDFFAE8|nr:PAS domain S-box protein [Rhizobium sp. BK251]
MEVQVMRASEPTISGLLEFDDTVTAVLDAIPQPIIIKDELSRFRFLNQSACLLLGKSRAELSGGTDHDILPMADADRIRNMDRHVFATGEDVSFEEEITFPDGTTSTFVTQKHRIEVDRTGSHKDKLVVVTTRNVTARRKAEAKLRASEEHYRSLVELNPQVPWTADPFGSVLEAGPRWKVITGFDPAEALGNGWAKAIHPADLPATQRLWSKSIATGDPLDVEYRLATTMGGYRWFRSRAAARKTQDGRVIRWYGTVEDVDEVHTSLEALKESEARFRSIADDAPVMIWVADEHGDATYHSRLWHETTGKTTDQASGSGWAGAVHPHDRSVVIETTSRVFRRQEDVRLEYRLRRADGDWAWVIDVGRPRFAPDGKFLGYVGIALDITERRKTELAREEADALVRSVFDSTPDCMRLLDPEGQPLLINEAGRRLFAGEGSGENGPRLETASLSRAKADEEYAQVQQGKTTRGESSICDAGGTVRHMDIITAPVIASSGNDIRMLEIWRDVTEARVARDEAIAARLEAEHSSDRLSRVLESTMDSVLVVNPHWEITYFNTRARDLLELDERAEGSSLWSLFPVDENSLFGVSYRRVMTERVGTTFEEYLPARGIWFEIHAAPTSEGMSIFFRDITARRNLERERLHAQRQLHHMARHDAVTGLPNLQLFWETFGDLMNEQPGSRTAILSLDLDGFKAVNDTQGHSAGDLLLRSAAARLRGCVEKQDVVARSGADEFAVVRTGISNDDDINTLAQEVLETLGEPYDLQGNQIDLGVSVGIAFAPEDGQTADQVLKAADIARNRAKAHGRGTCMKFAPAMDADIQASQRIKGSLRRALDNDEMELFYQPLVNLHTGKVTACETLVRGPTRKWGPCRPRSSSRWPRRRD